MVEIGYIDPAMKTLFNLFREIRYCGLDFGTSTVVIWGVSLVYSLYLVSKLIS